jgi:hypothetical protein
MRSKKVNEAVEAFDALDAAQTQWEEAYSELSEKEVAELEKRLLAQGVTFTNQTDKPKQTRGETLGDTSGSEQKSVECVNSTIAKAPNQTNSGKPTGEKL